MSDRVPTYEPEVDRAGSDAAPLSHHAGGREAAFVPACAGQGTVVAPAPLSTVLSSLAGERRTGLLRIGAGGEVWFHEGRVYLANGPGSPPLFDVLFGADVGSRQHLESICVEADRGGVAVVDRLGDEDPDVLPRLRRLLSEHALAALFELMVPTSAPMTFEADARHVLGWRFAEPTQDLLASVQRRVELWRRIAERVPSTAARFRLRPQLPAPATERVVTADEWSFLALLDGRRTVAGVITETGESAFRVCSLLYRLLLEELIEPVSD